MEASFNALTTDISSATHGKSRANKIMASALVGLSLSAGQNTRLAHAASFTSIRIPPSSRCLHHVRATTPPAFSLAPCTNFTPPNAPRPNTQLFYADYEIESQPEHKQTITRVSTLQAYKRVVADERERMVCVKFFSPYCRACKKIEPQFKRLAKTYPEIKFVEVPLIQNKKDDNSVLFTGLGVPSLPYGHLYHPQVGLVEECSINNKKIHTFEKTLSQYMQGFCPLDEEPVTG